MAEGPQVLRRTQWLHRHCAGRSIVRCESARDDIPADAVAGRTVDQVFCKGKHIFLELNDGQFLHNHLLMRGRWRKLEGQQLFLPDGTWLSLYLGPYTVCNLNGQKLKLVNADDVERQRNALGPDAMAQPFPDADIRRSLAESRLPVSEALLDQAIVAGIGNIAKSELLYRAGLDPRRPACELTSGQMQHLLAAMESVLWQSYRNGGRWECRIYQRRGRRCFQCGSTIDCQTLPPSRRATYFCPGCQS